MPECFLNQHSHPSLDLQSMVETLKFARRISNVEPYKKRVGSYLQHFSLFLTFYSYLIIVREVYPGPNCKSDEEIAGMTMTCVSFFFADAF